MKSLAVLIAFVVSDQKNFTPYYKMIAFVVSDQKNFTPYYKVHIENLHITAIKPNCECLTSFLQSESESTSKDGRVINKLYCLTPLALQSHYVLIVLSLNY